MKQFLTRVLAYVLLVAFFNSHILGPLSAAPFEFEDNHSSSAPPPRLPLSDRDLDQFGAPSGLRELLGEMWAEAQAVPAAERPALPHVQYLIEERIKAQEGAASRWGTRAISGVAALLAGIGLGGLDIFNNGIQGLLNIPDGPVPPVPGELWGVGIAAALLVLPEAYSAAHKGLEWLKRLIRRHNSDDAQDPGTPPSRGWSKTDVAYVGGMMAFFAAAVGKLLFSYIEVNLPPIPASLAVLATIAGIPLFGTLLSEAKEAYDKRWASTVSPPHTPSGEALRDRITAAFRKVSADAEGALGLYEQLQEIDAFLEQTTKEIETRLATLSDETEITHLRASLQSYQRMADLLKLQLLYRFAGDVEGADQEYQTPDRVKHKSTVGNRRSCGSWFCNKLFGKHPVADQAVKGGAMIASSLVYGAEFYALRFILESFGIPSSVATVMAGILDARIGTYLLTSVGERVRKVWRYFRGYNPVENEERISHPHIGRGVLRGILELLDWLRGAYLTLPASMVAGEGLYNSGFPLISQQLFLLIPNFVAFGATKGSNVDEIVTEASIKWSSDPKERAQQYLARELGRITEWMEGLTNNQRDELVRVLERNPLTWLHMSEDKDPESGVKAGGSGEPSPAGDYIPPKVPNSDETGVQEQDTDHEPPLLGTSWTATTASNGSPPSESPNESPTNGSPSDSPPRFQGALGDLETSRPPFPPRAEVPLDELPYRRDLSKEPDSLHERLLPQTNNLAAPVAPPKKMSFLKRCWDLFLRVPEILNLVIDA